METKTEDQATVTPVEYTPVAVPPMPTPESLKPKPITNLADLEAYFTKRREVTLDVFGQQCVMQVRTLTPAEDAVISGIIDAVVPPVERGRTIEDDRPNFSDPAYLKRREAAFTEARALAIYWAVPAMSAGQPGMTDTSAIKIYIQGSKVSVQVLNALYNAIRGGGVQEATLVNFT